MGRCARRPPPTSARRGLLLMQSNESWTPFYVASAVSIVSKWIATGFQAFKNKTAIEAGLGVDMGLVPMSKSLEDWVKLDKSEGNRS